MAKKVKLSKAKVKLIARIYAGSMLAHVELGWASQDMVYMTESEERLMFEELGRISNKILGELPVLGNINDIIAHVKKST